MERPSIDELMAQVSHGAEDIGSLKAGEMVMADAEGSSAAFFKNCALNEKNSGFFSGVAHPVGQKRMTSDLTAYLPSPKEERRQRPWAFCPRLQIRSAEVKA